MSFHTDKMVPNQNCEMVVFKKDPKKNNFWTYSPMDSLGGVFFKSKHGPLIIDSSLIFMERSVNCMSSNTFLSKCFNEPLLLHV